MAGDDRDDFDDGVPWAPPEIREEYTAALGRFILAYNQLDYLLTQILTMALTKLGRDDIISYKGREIQKQDFSSRLYVLDILKSTSQGEGLCDIPIKAMRDLSAERAVLAHGHMDQNPFDGTYTLVKGGQDKGPGYTSDRIDGLAKKADELWDKLRYAEAYFTFDKFED